MDNTAIVPAKSQPSGIGLMARFSPRARALIMLSAAGVIAIVSAAWLWSASPSYSVLFTNLSDRDGGAVIAQLSQMNVPYRNADGGTILVPAEKVHEARLRLASQGLPKGSVVGFELLESQKFGLTQFQEQLNYQRGLEGELSRSIQSLAPVASARVHLALPKNSGFLRDRQVPTASVLLQLHPGKTLDRAQVAGIVHLVASSVPELTTKNVSVVDQHGALLASQHEGEGNLDGEQLDYVSQIEASTIKRIEDILEPIVGRTNVRAQVTVDVDFSNVEQMDESYKPNQAADKSAVRSQSSNENSQTGSAGAQGVPGALSNQPPVPATAPAAGVDRRWRSAIGAMLLGFAAILAGTIWLLWPVQKWSVENSRPFISSAEEEWDPAFSPGGAMLTYVVNSGTAASRLFVRNIAGGDPIQLNTGRFNATSPAWASDGVHIAYLASGDKQPCAIMVTTVPAGEPREIGHCNEDSGQILSWHRAVDSIDVDGEARRVIVAVHAGIGAGNA